MLDVQLDPNYVEELKRSVENRHKEHQHKRLQKKREMVQELYADSDGTFAYIAGYTSAGFPYGVTWEEIGEDPPDFDDV